MEIPQSSPARLTRRGYPVGKLSIQNFNSRTHSSKTAGIGVCLLAMSQSCRRANTNGTPLKRLKFLPDSNRRTDCRVSAAIDQMEAFRAKQLGGQSCLD